MVFPEIVRTWLRERCPMEEKIKVDDETYKLVKEYASKHSLKSTGKSACATKD
jgi:hypothetical protein